ncbi:unnamed protein product [Amoebophrya sp. A120]|nr:unnamed protein product [Amoebophrya sp. A120]|eukprot:GSA120T00023558001.1
MSGSGSPEQASGGSFWGGASGLLWETSDGEQEVSASASRRQRAARRSKSGGSGGDNNEDDVEKDVISSTPIPMPPPPTAPANTAAGTTTASASAPSDSGPAAASSSSAIPMPPSASAAPMAATASAASTAIPLPQGGSFNATAGAGVPGAAIPMPPSGGAHAQMPDEAGSSHRQEQDSSSSSSTQRMSFRGRKPSGVSAADQAPPQPAYFAAGAPAQHAADMSSSGQVQPPGGVTEGQQHAVINPRGPPLMRHMASRGDAIPPGDAASVYTSQDFQPQYAQIFLDQQQGLSQSQFHLDARGQRLPSGAAASFQNFQPPPSSGIFQAQVFDSVNGNNAGSFTGGNKDLPPGGTATRASAAQRAAASSRETGFYMVPNQPPLHNQNFGAGLPSAAMSSAAPHLQPPAGAQQATTPFMHPVFRGDFSPERRPKTPSQNPGSPFRDTALGSNPTRAMVICYQRLLSLSDVEAHHVLERYFRDRPETKKRMDVGLEVVESCFAARIDALAADVKGHLDHALAQRADTEAQQKEHIQMLTNQVSSLQKQVKLLASELPGGAGARSGSSTSLPGKQKLRPPALPSQLQTPVRQPASLGGLSGAGRGTAKLMPTTATPGSSLKASLNTTNPFFNAVE